MDEAQARVLQRINAAYEEGALSLDLSRCGLVEWSSQLDEALGRLTWLQKLDVSRSELSSLPRSLERLTGLQILNASFNTLSSLPESLGGLSNLQELYIWRNRLSSLPDSLGGLTNLQKLHVSDNRLSSLPDSLGGLTNLQELHVSDNQLSPLPEFLGDLMSLQELFIWRNQLSSLPEFLGELTNLQTLHVGQNQLSSLPEFLGELTNLQTLHVGQNQLSSLPEFLGELTNLQTLHVGKNQLSSLPDSLGGLTNLQKLHVSDNQLSSLPEFLGGLTNLKELDVSQNQLSSLPESLGRLTNLQELNVSQNQLSSLPEFLGGLTNLKELDVSQNQLSSLPEFLDGLTNLEILDVSRNRLLLLSQWVSDLPELRMLYLWGNHIKNIPLALLDAEFRDCLPSVRAHFADLKKGAREDRSLQCIFLGNGRVGKSCIVDRLLGMDFDTERASTHAIRLELWKLPGRAGEDEIQLLLRDFGGQDIYHGTHRLFARARAVFVIVWDAESENNPESDDGTSNTYANYPLAYWLDYVARQSRGASVIVVQNKMDLDPGIAFQPADYAKYAARFRSMKSCQVSAASNLGFDVLQAHLWAAALEVLGEPGSRQHGSGRVQVLRQLQDRERESVQDQSRNLSVISRSEFEALCNQSDGISSVGLFLEFLHDAGVVFYDPRYLPDIVIVDQAWAIDGIYALFNRARTLEPLIKTRGRFTRPQLEEFIWKDSGYTVEEQNLFLEFMQACELCFKLNDEGPEYLAPELAPAFEEADSALLNFSSQPTLIFIYEHEVLHPHLARRFFVQVGRVYADRASYFRDAVEFRTPDRSNVARVRMIVEAGALRLQGKIEISIQGPDRVTLLAAIRDRFESMHDFGLPLPMRVSVDGGKFFASLDSVENAWRTGAKKVPATDNTTLLDMTDFAVLCRPEDRPVDLTNQPLPDEELKQRQTRTTSVQNNYYGPVIHTKDSNIAWGSPGAAVGDVTISTQHFEDMRRVAQNPIFYENERRLFLEIIAALAKAVEHGGKLPEMQQAAQEVIKEPDRAWRLTEIFKKLHGFLKRGNDEGAPYLTIAEWLPSLSKIFETILAAIS